MTRLILDTAIPEEHWNPTISPQNFCQISVTLPVLELSTILFAAVKALSFKPCLNILFERTLSDLVTGTYFSHYSDGTDVCPSVTNLH